MNINSLSFLKFNNISGLQLKKQAEENQQRKISSNFNSCCYPKNYYLNQVSFGLNSRLSAVVLIAKIGEENFPSQEIVKKLKSLGNSNEFSLYDIHLDHYKDLFNCSTLEEVKHKYPEFKDVIDSKNINYKSYPISSVIYRVGNKKVSGLDIKDLSLELLKKYYGQIISPNKKEIYYNFDHSTIGVLFNLLNIKKMNCNYILFAFKSNEAREKLSNAQKGRIVSPKTREKMSKAHKGQTVSQGTRDKLSNANKGRVLSQETRDKMSKAQQARMANAENRKRRAIAQKARMAILENREKYKKFGEVLSLVFDMYPQFTGTMKEIAKKYPELGKIINKRKQEIPLSERENLMLMAFFKECNSRMPGYQKIIGEEYHKLLVEMGLIED